MGSKKALLIVLGLILLSSSVIAVDFEWALGDSRTKDAYGNLRYDIGEAYENLDVGPYGPQPIEPRMLLIYLYYRGRSPSGGCGVKLTTKVNYNDLMHDVANSIGKERTGENYYYLIADSVSYGFTTQGCFAWCGVGGLFGCCNNCWVQGHFLANYVQVSVSGKGSVFIQDQVKSIDTIQNLMGGQLPPTGETVYLGIDDTDVIYWIGKQGDEYNAQKEILDPAADDYLNVCTDMNRNGVCDYKEDNVQKCLNAGADWYNDICCGEDPGAITQATGLTAVNCSFQPNNFGKDIYAFCGKTLDGRWRWAPLNDDYGNIHELLACPGFSLVSDKNNFYGCKGGTVQGVTDTVQGTQLRQISTDAPLPKSSVNYIPITGMINISGALGTHEYICTSGEIFECAGDIASYTYNPDSVAETGLTTSELLGSGGCPPKIISYWTFDDGNAKDTKGAFNGNKFGATASNGKVGGALSFSGTDRIEIPASLSAGSELTVEAWIKPIDSGGLRKIIEKGDSFRIAIDDVSGGRTLVGAVNTGTGLTNFGSRTVISNVWHHVALTYDGVVAKLYLDGKAVEDITTGNLSWSSQPIIIGGNFMGDIDEVAIYGKALRGSLMTLHAKNPVSYCQAQPGAAMPDSYCAADGDWTTDLDIKDQSSCNKAGFHWTGTMCCSELDDPSEYYNEHDTPAADFSTAVVARHAGAQVESGQIILSNLGHYATIKGPALLAVETHSAESATDIGACPKLSTVMVPVAPWESKTVKILDLGDSGDPCRYRWKIITSVPIIAFGGCWNKTFVERGSLINPKILNYQGAFFGCALPVNSPFLALKDTHTNNNLLTNLQPTCASIKTNAAGPGNHSVCGPGGVWLFTGDAGATFTKAITWDPADYGITVLSTSGCCSDDQCWDGFECVDEGNYYAVGEDAFICRQ